MSRCQDCPTEQVAMSKENGAGVKLETKSFVYRARQIFFSFLLLKKVRNANAALLPTQSYRL